MDTKTEAEEENEGMEELATSPPATKADGKQGELREKYRHTKEKLGISLSQHGSAKPMVSPRNGSGGFNEI